MAPIRTQHKPVSLALQTPPSQTHYSSGVHAGTAQPPIPSIRLISATPSAIGSSTDGSTGDASMRLMHPWETTDPPPMPEIQRVPKASALALEGAAQGAGMKTKTLRSVRSVLKPKNSGNSENAGPERKVVLKKSKLGLLGSFAGGGGKEKEKGKDLSDVVRRVGAQSINGVPTFATVSPGGSTRVHVSKSTTTSKDKPVSKTSAAPSGKNKGTLPGRTSSVKLKGGFDIYVDPSFDDPEIGEILVVKKKKSRAGLDAVGEGWGPASANANVAPALYPSAANGSNALGEVTNTTAPPENGLLLRVKNDDERKWWSIGRGRKDSKEAKEAKAKKDGKENAVGAKAGLPQRSQTPEPFAGLYSNSATKTETLGRGRFNSLDAGLLLGTNKPAAAPSAGAPRSTTPSIRIEDEGPETVKRARSASIALGGLLAPPGSLRGTGSVRLAPAAATLAVPKDAHAPAEGYSQGSIALRAIRSVKSLARIGTWGHSDASEAGISKDSSKAKDSSSKAKESSKEKKSKKSKKEKKPKGTSKDTKDQIDDGKLVAGRARGGSTSSFEAGALTSSPAPPVRSQSAMDHFPSTTSYSHSHLVNSQTLTAGGRAQSSMGFYTGVGEDEVDGRNGFDSATVGRVLNFDAAAHDSTTVGKSSSVLGAPLTLAGKSSTVGKKKSILGLGLPSSMRLPSLGLGMRQASNTSSISSGAQFGATVLPGNRISVDSAAPSSRLSVDSAYALGGGMERRASIQSTGSSLRPVSVTSTISGISTADSRLSVDARGEGGRRVSIESRMTGGSIRSGVSGASGVSGVSGGSGITRASSGTGSVRWDEGVLEREKVREERRRESGEPRRDMHGSHDSRDSGDSRETKETVKEGDAKGSRKGSRSGTEARKRTALSDVFPDVAVSLASSRRKGRRNSRGSTVSSVSGDDQGRSSGDKRSSIDSKRFSGESKRYSSDMGATNHFRYPILTIEEATNDGHGDLDLYERWRDSSEDGGAESQEGGEDSKSSVDGVATPVKKARPRPMSEQLLGRTRTFGRPAGVYEDEDGVLSVLSQATNDLALLINNLDLEATPATPDMTPLKPCASPFSSEPNSVVSTRLRPSDAVAGLSAEHRPKALSASQKIKEMCNASPTQALKERKRAASYGAGAQLALAAGSVGAATGGGVKAIVARLNAEAEVEGTSKGSTGSLGVGHVGGTLTVRSSISSITSLRPYAQSRRETHGKGSLGGSKGSIGPSVAAIIEEEAGRCEEAREREKEKQVKKDGGRKDKPMSPSMFVKTHKRTMTPAPEPEPAPVFLPLRPPSGKMRTLSTASNATANKLAPVELLSIRPLEVKKHKLSRESPMRVKDAFCDASGDEDEERFRTLRVRNSAGLNALATSSSTLGGAGTIRGAKSTKRLSTSSKKSVSGLSVQEGRAPITREARRILGMSGTMGGSDVSAYQVEIDESDPDSDVPEELRFILRKDEGGKGSVRGKTYNRSVPLYRREEDDMDDDVVLKDGKPLRDEDDEDDLDDESVMGDGGAEEATFETSIEVPRSVSVSPFFDVFPAGALRGHGALKSDHLDVPVSPGLGNSLLGSSAGSVAEVHRAQRLPVFRAQLVPDNQARGSATSSPAPSAFNPTHAYLLDEGYLTASYSSSSEGNDQDTKRSFDFTGELAKLNESGASDRRSFVEQLETAFKTPAKVGLDFGSELFKLAVPPVPELPIALNGEASVESSVVERSVQEGEVDESNLLSVANGTVDASSSGFLGDEEESYSIDAGRDVLKVSTSSQLSLSHLSIKKQPSSLSASQTSKGSTRSIAESSSVHSKLSTSSKNTSNGELNRSFRFGGLSSANPSPAPATKEKAEAPLTLSSIIPSPSHAREISFSSSMLDDYEDSVLKSLLAKANASPQESEDDDALSLPAPNFARPSVTTLARNNNSNKRISFVPLTRPSSGISFAGLDSFDEVRRGFEFHDYRPAFYPPPNTALPTGVAPAFSSGIHQEANNSSYAGGYGRRGHRKAQDSVWSIASVSSYGRVLKDGAPDPFDYGVPPPMPSLRESLRERIVQQALDKGEISVQAPSEKSMEGGETMGHETYSADMTDSMSFEMSTNVDDTFSFLKNRPTGYGRKRVDSDASSFYFKGPSFTHRRRESNFSVSSITGFATAPPVSLFTRGHHRRTSSVTSASSVALSYAMHGVAGARSILERHRRESSMDSMMSNQDDYSMHSNSAASFRNLGRPGLGDKMFETGAGYLDAIAGSPSQSVNGNEVDMDRMSVGDLTNGNERNSSGSFDYYDSILDGEDGRRVSVSSYEGFSAEGGHAMVEDSLFDKTVLEKDESVCVFDDSNVGGGRGRLLPENKLRPLSILSNTSIHSPMKEDDTMISMLGGGHVRRRSIEASPCVRMEKRRPRQRQRVTARMVYHGTQLVRTDAEGNEIASPQKEQKNSGLVEKPSIASSFQFGDERMVNARRGLLERQSLEENCLVAEGEDTNHSFRAVPVFTRPTPASRSRSSTTSTCTTSSESSAGDTTPPLSPTGGYHSSSASISGSSMSSIDLAELNLMLTNPNTMHPVSTLASARTRMRANGSGHRRRYSHAQRMSISRGSMYETIEEESNASSSEGDTPNVSLNASATKKLISAVHDTPTAVYIVDSDTQSIQSLEQDPEQSVWDDEKGIVAMRKFYNLKDEAQTTVVESQRTWRDTPFSVFAVQSFDPPRHPDGMKALLEHSLRNYVPLPAELRRMRSRKNSRPSPYPQARIYNSSMSSSPAPPLPIIRVPPIVFKAEAAAAATPVLQQRSLNTLNVDLPMLDAIKPISPFMVHVAGNGSPRKQGAAKKSSNGTASEAFIRPRVPSAVRRSALGWTKRSSGVKTSTDKKENIGQGHAMTPNDSLRITRPRPRGRTPGSQARPLR